MNVAELTSTSWMMVIYSQGPNGELQPFYAGSGVNRYDRRIEEPINVPEADWCSGGPRNVPDKGYCSQLPPGLLYYFSNSFIRPAPYGVLLDDGKTFVSGIGGQTVWQKQ